MDGSPFLKREKTVAHLKTETTERTGHKIFAPHLGTDEGICMIPQALQLPNALRDSKTSFSENLLKENSPTERVPARFYNSEEVVNKTNCIGITER